MNEKHKFPEEEPRPATEHKAVLVETEGFQCMAYQDCYGKWRRFYDLKPLRGKVDIVAIN